MRILNPDSETTRKVENKRKGRISVNIEGDLVGDERTVAI